MKSVKFESYSLNDMRPRVLEYFGEKFVTNVLINTVLNFGETATLGNEAFNVHDVHTSSRAEGTTYWQTDISQVCS